MSYFVEFTTTEVKKYAKIIYTGAGGVNYRATPDYKATPAGAAHKGEVFTVVGEVGDFYLLKSGWYLTNRADMVELIKTT